ncbi:hypothetical protein TNCV_1340141 [Trichonephila clavipes]|uniref:Uncharacterized protein n=1 Tax=Trichonephila clavipes TaxID=2585209 RepID=A0A8X6R724_TRICX|nr:hypothetical protein TNCV_1340141 [Trichonephila clavipes]
MVTPTLMSDKTAVYLILAEVAVHWRAMMVRRSRIVIFSFRFKMASPQEQAQAAHRNHVYTSQETGLRNTALHSPSCNG